MILLFKKNMNFSTLSKFILIAFIILVFSYGTAATDGNQYQLLIIFINYIIMITEFIELIHIEMFQQCLQHNNINNLDVLYLFIFLNEAKNE